MTWDDLEWFAAKAPEHRKAEARALRSAVQRSSGKAAGPSDGGEG